MERSTHVVAEFGVKRQSWAPSLQTGPLTPAFFGGAVSGLHSPLPVVYLIVPARHV